MTNTTALRTAAKGTAPAAGKDLKALLASPAIIKRPRSTYPLTTP